MRFLLAFCAWLAAAVPALAETGYDLWLRPMAVPFARVEVAGTSETAAIMRRELDRGAGTGRLVVGTPSSSPTVKQAVSAADLVKAGEEGFVIQSKGRLTIIGANTDLGALHGVFHLLRLIATKAPLDRLHVVEAPVLHRRLLNHWDNLDGSIERGYAGPSLWKWDELPDRIDPRYRDYARANASIGINGVVLNNVNADARILTSAYLAKVRTLADLFRPYGIRVYLSVNFGAPLGQSGEGELAVKRSGIGTLHSADPLDPEVRAWWRAKTEEIYGLIPDFGGYLVKANSEGMPGPQDYGRTHADGANMLAEALAPHGGVVMWRSFVYSPDVDKDRAKRGYKEFAPLDGKFAANVFVQPKNGPLDFQPLEPVNPLFDAMPRTPLMLEVQVTQEYLGQADSLVYLAPLWKRALDAQVRAMATGHHADSGIAGVANVGGDANWTGHDFAQANWYAFGRLAWNPSLSADAIAEEWIRQSWGNDRAVVGTLGEMMAASWPAAVDYMTPLGLVFTVEEREHYDPDLAAQKGLYWRADHDGLGYDRTASGSDYAGQYKSPLREQWNDLAATPEDELIFFHFVPWDHRLKSGRTLWEELLSRYDRGVAAVQAMSDEWRSLKGRIDDERYAHVAARLDTQLVQAQRWRDASIAYFKEAAGR